MAEGEFSQDQIDQLLNQASSESADDGGAVSTMAGGPVLGAHEQDTVGELNHIAMGAAASALSVILSQPAEATSPQIEQHANLAIFNEPFVGDDKIFVQLQYAQGLEGNGGFVVKSDQAKALSDMMLGGSGQFEPGPLSDLQMSAVAEAFNQMMNAAATSMASMIGRTIEVKSPEVLPYSPETLSEFLPTAESGGLISITQDLQLGQNLTLNLVQLWPTNHMKEQIRRVMAVQPTDDSPPGAAPVSAAASNPSPYADPPPGMGPVTSASFGQATAQPGVGGPVTVQPVQFGSFDEQVATYGEANKNLGLVLDVTLNLTVELGRAEIPIREVLELTRGSVIELDRLAGEPVDLLANGKLIAKGEVVVIEDNFGLRITSIVSPAERLRNL
jgi:flagellar motor switch protein FliN/FliY